MPTAQARDSPEKTTCSTCSKSQYSQKHSQFHEFLVKIVIFNLFNIFSELRSCYKLAQTRKINGKFHPKLEMKAEEAERSENQENSSFNTTKESRPHTNK